MYLPTPFFPLSLPDRFCLEESGEAQRVTHLPGARAQVQHDGHAPIVWLFTATGSADLITLALNIPAFWHKQHQIHIF